MINKNLYHYFIFYTCFLLTILNTSCKKEYSFEGENVVATVLPPNPVNEFPGCSSCKITNEMAASTWNFKIGNTYACGFVDAAGTLGEKTAFTFFGPSACSIDTGLVMTVYLPLPLNEDNHNLTTTKVAFYYYDHNAPNDIFISKSTTTFSLTIESFISATGIATGTFSGTAFKPNGETAIIKEGRFIIKLK